MNGKIRLKVVRGENTIKDYPQLIARNVRRYRRERGLSMSGLAARAGLSKQTMSGIEHGTGNPTVETLGILSAALGIPIRRLLTEWGTPVYVQRSDDVWTLTGTGEERMLDEVYGSGYVRTSLLRLTRRHGEIRPVEAHSLGSLHHLYVITGRVRTGPVTEPVELAPGDFSRYPGDVAHTLEALSDRAVVHLVTTVPQVRQIRD